MAYLCTTYCSICKKQTQHQDNQCLSCSKTAIETERQRWASLTSEQKIEELHQRLRELEQPLWGGRR